ncbi:MAG: hypothetical protein JXQ76_00475 [Campylobacterales bacterium]|nr:hypothetical protein [Campylobacterales bacterium]
MKKLASLIVALLLAATTVLASSAEDKKVSVSTVPPTHNTPLAKPSFEKQGFLTTKWCAQQGMFTDCRLETVVCGEGGCFKKWEFGDKETLELVIFVHDEGKYYEISPQEGLHVSELIEEGLSRNEVTIKGSYDKSKNIILATSFDAPPPPKKSFFKGCL